jgi:hypothetical protein
MVTPVQTNLNPINSNPSVNRNNGISNKAKMFIGLASASAVGVLAMSFQDTTPQQQLSSLFSYNLNVYSEAPASVATTTESKNLVASSAPSPSPPPASPVTASANVIQAPKAQPKPAPAVQVVANSTYKAIDLNGKGFKKVGDPQTLNGLGEFQFYQVEGETGKKTYYISSVKNPTEQLKLTAIKSSSSAPLSVSAECTKAFQKRVVSIRPQVTDAATEVLVMKSGKVTMTIDGNIDSLNATYIELN